MTLIAIVSRVVIVVAATAAAVSEVKTSVSRAYALVASRATSVRLVFRSNFSIASSRTAATVVHGF